MVELLPCPFCGKHDEGLRSWPPTCERDASYNPADRGYPVVRCGKCGVEMPGDNWDQSKRSAIAAWNRRALANREGSDANASA